MINISKQGSNLNFNTNLKFRLEPKNSKSILRSKK